MLYIVSYVFRDVLCVLCCAVLCCAVLCRAVPCCVAVSQAMRAVELEVMQLRDELEAKKRSPETIEEK